MKEQYYQLLNLNPGASAEQIKVAYRKLAKKYHPDKNKNADPAYFQKITEAYNVLSDPDQKLKYDRKRKQAQSGNINQPVSNMRRRRHRHGRGQFNPREPRYGANRARKYTYKAKPKIDYDAFVGYFKIPAILSFSLAVLLFVDFWTTTHVERQEISKIELTEYRQKIERNSKYELRVITKDINVRVHPENISKLRQGFHASLYSTFFLRIPKKMIVEGGEGTLEIILARYFYVVAAAIIMIMGLIVYLYKFDSKMIIELGSAAFFLMLIMLFLAFWNN